MRLRMFLTEFTIMRVYAASMDRERRTSLNGLKPGQAADISERRIRFRLIT